MELYYASMFANILVAVKRRVLISICVETQDDQQDPTESHQKVQ